MTSILAVSLVVTVACVWACGTKVDRLADEIRSLKRTINETRCDLSELKVPPINDWK